MVEFLDPVFLEIFPQAPIIITPHKIGSFFSPIPLFFVGLFDFFQKEIPYFYCGYFGAVDIIPSLSLKWVSVQYGLYAILSVTGAW